MADDSDEEKTEDPTEHRIEEYRKRGEVASSKDLTSVLILAACVMTLSLSTIYVFETIKEYVEWLYALDIRAAFSSPIVGKTIMTKTVMTALTSIAPIFLVSVSMGVISSILQFGFLFAPEVLQLKFDRIDPIQGFKRLFSFRSIVEAIKGIFKFTIIISIVYFYIKDDLLSYSGFLHMDYFQGFLHAKGMIVKIVMAMITGLLVVAAGDFAYQKFSYTQKLKMTKQQAKEEHKSQEGNPEVRAKIKAIQREMSQRRMMASIPTADAIVTNPTHFAVAIKYDPETMISPEIVAKGADHLAMRIREIAKQHNVPLVENVQLARNLYNTVKVGQGVPRPLYKAVAEVLAFVYRLKKKQKALQ